MLKLKKVAITGGLSCGKSTVCRIFKDLGAFVVSADNIVHHLLSSDKNLSLKIVELLGPEVLVNNQLDRSKITRIVFQNRRLLNALEKIMHPAVYKEIDNEYDKQKFSLRPPPLFIAEIPLLFESGGKRDYDAIIAVVADDEICLERFKQETGYGSAEYNHRTARQFPIMDKAKQADYVITNNGSLIDLQKAARELYQKLIK